MDKLIPKGENADKGFHYTVSDEQIAAYAKWTIEEKLDWLAETAKFADSVLTDEERQMMFNSNHEKIMQTR